MDDILTYCKTCDTTHGLDCPANPFGPAETITVGDLAEGDFVVSMPAQYRVRGYRINSGVREIGPAGYHGWKYGPPRRKTAVRSRRVTFLDRELGALDVPVYHEVIVRRRAA
jgi:hypothetical protein